MFEDLKASINQVLSADGIDVYDEYSDIDLIKSYNQNVGFLSVKKVEKINDYKNLFNIKSCEVFVTLECKVIAKKGISAEAFSQTMNNIYTDFLFSDDFMPVSLDLENLKINSLYSRLETNLIFKFRYFLTDTV